MFQSVKNTFGKTVSESQSFLPIRPFCKAAQTLDFLEGCKMNREVLICLGIIIIIIIMHHPMSIMQFEIFEK